KTLLRQAEADQGEPRFWMLETIREYAGERLEESGEAGDVRQQHVAHFLALVESADPEMISPRQLEWLMRLDAEHDNIRSALAYSLWQEDAESALRITASLGTFWNIRGHLSEGRIMLGDALGMAGAAQRTALRARALHVAGELAFVQGNYES